MGITGQLLAWLEAYLADRQQLVSIHGEFSGLLPVTSGVPHGSLLGPLLFSVQVTLTIYLTQYVSLSLCFLLMTPIVLVLCVTG